MTACDPKATFSFLKVTMKSSRFNPFLLNYLLAVMLLAVAFPVSGGDDASGPISYQLDLSAPFTQYEMTESDVGWSESLVENLGYKGEVVHFVRTSIAIDIDGVSNNEAVYKAVLGDDIFYVAEGDAMLKVGNKWPYSPGVGGFSMHAPRSKNFIVCLNCLRGGVPHMSGTEVQIGPVSWMGHDFKRL